jgi:hypothetical protein
MEEASMNRAVVFIVGALVTTAAASAGGQPEAPLVVAYIHGRRLTRTHRLMVWRSAGQRQPRQSSKLADENVVVDTVFRDPRLPVFFIEASRQKNPRPSCCSMFPPNGCEYSRRPTSAAVDGLRAGDFRGSGLRAEHHAG